MNRNSFGVLVLLLALPALGGEDKSPSLQQQYDALAKESQQERGEHTRRYREAKTVEDRQKATKEHEARTSRIATGYLALLEKAPKDRLAIDALSGVLALDGAVQEKKKAAALLLREYLKSDKIDPVCRSLALKCDEASVTLLRTLLAKSPHQRIRAEASFALAKMLNEQLTIAKEIKQDPEHTELLELFAGKEAIEELRNKDVDALERAVEKTWSEFAEKHSADIPEDRLRIACAWLSYSSTNEIETALRSLEKDKRRAVRGIACLTLGHVLKRRADTMAEMGDKAAVRVRNESAETLGRAADKYGDVKIMWHETNVGGLVGEKAKHELYELRHLSIGMKAPEIDGADQDGKRFKLSDYKGKVVLLDFWSQH